MTTLLALALLSGDAHAASDEVYGVGLKIGTIALPGLYPAAFPKQIRQSDTTELQKVQTDVHLGLEGVYYLAAEHRVGAVATYAFGSGYGDRSAMLKYGYVNQMDFADLHLGGGVGVGRTRFKTDGKEDLRIPYYPLRVEAGPLVRLDWCAIQADAFVQYNLPWAHYYTAADGSEEDLGPGVYLMGGVELAFFLGEFAR